MALYKTVIVVEAEQFTGDNYQTIFDFLGDAAYGRHTGEGVIYFPVLMGKLAVEQGDWIIKTGNGDFDICKPRFFEAEYEAL